MSRMTRVDIGTSASPAHGQCMQDRQSRTAIIQCNAADEVGDGAVSIRCNNDGGGDDRSRGGRTMAASSNYVPAHILRKCSA